MSSFYRFLLDNLGLKALSLLLALLLWFQIAGKETIQSTLSLPVQFVNIPTQLEIANDYDKEVDVIVRSDRRGMTFDDENMAVVVDLSGAGPTPERSFPLGEENIQNRPFGVDILSITPARIRLKLENTLRKYVEVVPRVMGEPAEGFEVTSVHASPVMVSGPESTVEEVTQATTEPIGIDGLISSIVQRSAVDIENPRLRIEPTSVNVVVTIEEERRDVRIRRIPVELQPEGSDAQLLTARIEIRGTVPVSFMGELTAADFQVSVDVGSLEPRQDPYELQPRVEPTEAYLDIFRLSTLNPEIVKVRRIR